MHRRNKCLLTLGRPLATTYLLVAAPFTCQIASETFFKIHLDKPDKVWRHGWARKKSPSTPHFDEFSSIRYEAHAGSLHKNSSKCGGVEGSRVEGDFFLIWNLVSKIQSMQDQTWKFQVWSCISIVWFDKKKLWKSSKENNPLNK